MDRLRGSTVFAAFVVGALTMGGAMVPGSIVPAQAQTAPTPGSTINGTVPSSEGNVWGGLDHQPTPSEVAPLNNQQQQAKINRKLNKLDQELLNYQLPKVPNGAPPVAGN
jgi:hypothetical protein